MTSYEERTRGYTRLLSRMEEAKRDQHCTTALEEELRFLLAQLRQCTQSVANAQQVVAATRRLAAANRDDEDDGNDRDNDSDNDTATATATAALGTTRTSRKLIRQLQRQQRVATDLFRQLIPEEISILDAATSDDAVKQEKQEKPMKMKKEKTSVGGTEETTVAALLMELRRLLRKQPPPSWLDGALDVARRVVRMLCKDNTMKHDDTTESTLDKLCHSLLNNTATHAPQVPKMAQLLRRLGKKRPDWQPLVRRLNSRLANKEKEFQASKLQVSTEAKDGHTSSYRKRAKEASSAAPKYDNANSNKKRRLSDPLPHNHR